MRAKGFTLVELVVIIMVIGVLALFVSGRFVQQSSFDVRGYHDELVAAARFAQRYAVASGCAVQLDITATTYSLNLLDSAPGCAATSVQRPDGGNFSGSAPTGVSVSGALGSYVFNALGDASAAGNIAVLDGDTMLAFTVSTVSGFVVAD